MVSRNLAAIFTTFAVAAVTFLAITTAHADSSSQQSNKNLWRNLAIGSGVVAGHGLITHNGTETLLGVAGAAYSANRYEQDRHHQSQDNARRQQWYRNRQSRSYYRSSGYRTYAYAGHTYRYNPRTGSRTMIG